MVGLEEAVEDFSGARTVLLYISIKHSAVTCSFLAAPSSAPSSKTLPITQQRAYSCAEQSGCSNGPS